MAERWIIEAELGRGGFARIYAATHALLPEKEVAIKLLDRRWLGNYYVMSSFAREGRILAALRCPQVIGIHDMGLHESVPFLVLERLHGCDLRKRLDRGLPCDREEILALIDDITEALEHVHALGVVHRDVSPRNVFCERGTSPSFKLLDFGLAQGPGERASGQEITAGTLPYMAPEVLVGSSRTFDGRVDVYGLAAVAYEALTGLPPIDGDGLEETMERVLFDVPMAAHRLRPAIPPAVSEVLARALSKRPQDRQATPAMLRGELQAAWPAASESESDESDGVIVGPCSRRWPPTSIHRAAPTTSPGPPAARPRTRRRKTSYDNQ